MKSVNVFAGILLLFGILLSAGSAWSAMVIHPRVSLEEEYNDNIFLSSTDEEEDWITTIAPGVSLTYNNRSIDATIDYSLRYRFYKNNDDDNIDNFKDVQRADATALFFDGRPFTVRVSERISSEALDERENTADYNELVNRSTLYHLTVVPEYRLLLMPTFSLVVGYTYERLDYVEPAGDDSEEHQGRIALEKSLSSNTEISAGFAYRVHQADTDDEDFDRQDYTLGVTHQLGARTTATIAGGYAEVEYDSGFNADLLTWLADVAYRLTEILTLSMHYSQDFAVSATEGVTETSAAGIAVDYERESLTATTELYWYNSDYLLQDREDEAMGLRFDLSKPLGSAVTLNVDAEYELAQYNDLGVDEEVDRLTLGTSLDYVYRRFLTSLGYRHRINESDIDSNDYTNNIVTLSGTVRF